MGRSTMSVTNHGSCPREHYGPGFNELEGPTLLAREAERLAGSRVATTNPSIEPTLFSQARFYGRLQTDITESAHLRLDAVPRVLF